MDWLREYAGKRVFVTGHTGFKGSWLCAWLRHLGAEVYGYALPPATQPSNFALCGLATQLAGHTEADIRDRQALTQALLAARPQAIFHLAAQALVRASLRDPGETFAVNVMGCATLLDALRETGLPCAVVIVTSDKCYENVGQVWGYREGDPLGGHDPYSASKGAAEILVASYRRSFFPPEEQARHGVRLATARAGNAIGGGDWAADRIVTDIVRHLSRGEAVPVRNPHSVRPWQHLLEPLSGYLQLGSKLLASPEPRWCSAWNFGPRPGDDASVRTLVETFCQAWGGGRWEQVGDPSATHEAAILRLAIDKSLTQLGWRPRWDLGTTVRRTVRWYQRCQAMPAEALAACLDDIRAYEDTLH